MNILVSDSLSPRGVAVLEQGGFQVDVKTKLPKEQLLEEIKAYDGIVVRSGTKVTADVIDAGSRLKIIGRAGTGLDNVDCDAATRRGIVVDEYPRWEYDYDGGAYDRLAGVHESENSPGRRFDQGG